MTGHPDTKSGDGLSFETLLIASISSAVAAIVVSQFWQGGTPIAAAVTPVLVALVSEGLRRPMRSDVVRRPARRAAEIGTGPLRPRESGWRERLSGRRVRIALVTGVLAFVAAALVLTLPELLFGGSVSGTDRDTTFFGGGSRDDDEERDSERTPEPDNPPGSAPIPDEEEAEPPTEEPPSEEAPPPDTRPDPGAPVPQPPPETPTQTEP